MKSYVVSFIFKPNLKYVWLIKKNKPEWQKGLLNGIGGKIESNESPVEAARREILEEAGIIISEPLIKVGHMIGNNDDNNGFICHIFTTTTKSRLITKEEEEVDLYRIKDLKDEPMVENVPMLIEACKYILTTKSNFSQLIMRYYGG